MSSATSPFIPSNQTITWERVDQGQDLRTNPGGDIIAPWPGTVSIAPPDPNGFGTHYALYTPTSGPHKGLQFYIGHVWALLTGKVSAGQPIAKTGTGSESWMGNAKGIPGHTEIGLWPPGSMSAGSQVAPIVKGQAGPAVDASSSTPSSTSTGDSSGGGGFSPGDLLNPAKFAGDVLGAIFKPIEDNALRMLLYAVLIVGGVALVTTGGIRLAHDQEGVS